MTDLKDIQNFREKNKRIRQRQQREAYQLAKIITQRLAEESPLIPVLSFYAYGYEGVATVQIFGNTARLSRWTDIGPMGHYDIKDVSQLAYELRMEGFNPVEDSNAGQLVEYWSKQPKWDDGLEYIRLQFLIGEAPL